MPGDRAAASVPRDYMGDAPVKIGRSSGENTMTSLAGKTHYLEDLAVGQEASMSRTVGEADIDAYAALSGDYNPVHIDPEYAAKTMFKERIAHGILSAGYISAVFGMQLPGPGSIYISQTLNFKGPVKIDDVVVTTVKVVEITLDKKRARFETICAVNGKPVLAGEAVLMVPLRPQA